MRLLLDTHTFLWFVFGDLQLSALARAYIEDIHNEKFLSMASIWEVSIKVGIQKITLTQPIAHFFTEQMATNSISLLPIEFHHAVRISTLPLHHRDPFDRMLIAQSLTEAVPILSRDGVFDRYGVTRYW